MNESAPIQSPENSRPRKDRGSFHKLYAGPKKIVQQIIGAMKIRPKVGTEDREEFKERLEELYRALDQSIDKLTENIEWQKKYGLVHHTRINNKQEFVDMLERGEHTIEFDVRGTKDNVPVVTHSITGHGSVGLFGKGIHEIDFVEAKELLSDVLSLEEALAIFNQYKEHHELIIEIKDESMVDEVVGLIKNFNLQNKIRIASLIPDVIRKTHELLPDIGLVMNSATVSYFDVPLLEEIKAGEREGKNILPIIDDIQSKGWSVVKIGRLEIVFSAGIHCPEEGITMGPKSDEEGRGKQTGYVFFRVPEDLIEILRKNQGRNAVSISALCVVGNITKIFAPYTGQVILDKAQHEMDQLGMNTLSAIGLSNLSSVAKHLDAAEQARVLRGIGVDIMYANDPVAIADSLINNNEKVL